MDKRSRRELVRALIELANSQLGGSIQLVEVHELESNTEIVFHRTYPLYEANKYETSEFTVIVRQKLVENV